MEILRKSQLIVALAAAAVVMIGRYWMEWRSHECLVVLALFAIWFVVARIAARVARPADGQALRIYDERASWNDRFSSAYEFLQLETPSPGQRLHLDQSLAWIEEALMRIPVALPLPKIRWVWVVPALALLLSLTPFLRHQVQPEEQKLTQAMQSSAKEQAAEIDSILSDLDEITPSTPEEKEALERLGREIDEVAGILEEAEGLTATEMLNALEERAHAAEKLAQKMGIDSQAWASPEMLAEMARHSDTAPLSGSLKDRKATESAANAGAIQEQLERLAPDSQGATRITASLKEIMNAAIESDHQKPVGERVGNASTKMNARQPRTAAREFEELAKHFRLLASKEATEEKLSQLAKQLREAGSDISGSELEKMERLAAADQSSQQGSAEHSSNHPDGLKALEEGAQAPLPLRQHFQLGGNPSSKQSAGENSASNPSATSSSSSSGSKPSGSEPSDQSFSMTAPTPGHSKENQDGAGNQGAGLGDESEAGKGGGGILSAPVPNDSSEPDHLGSRLMVRGGAGSRHFASGLEAGVGDTELDVTEGDLHDSTQDSKIGAQVNETGQSTFRGVAGQHRSEAATVTPHEVITEFLAVEEQALDEQAIPRSRRRQVIRYFSELRRQMEATQSLRP